GGVRPLSPDQPTIAGPAYTLRCLPYREDLCDPAKLGDSESSQRQTIEEAPPGSVIVIETRADTSAGVMGDILATRCRTRGVAGMVTDGAVRDISGMTASGFPVVCASATAPANIASFSDGGRQLAIACGGVCVVPGDAIIADQDGAIVIPADLVEAVVDDGEEQEDFEAWVLGEVEAGRKIFGLYPPDAETRARYEAHREDKP
ncbi:MAG: ribonuclease activity regulator RraA, partial [Rhodospirillaceae bacterium]|nr:ribonuclease activity regulator RraA [Rhodospirillaceae bacterium]